MGRHQYLPGDAHWGRTKTNTQFKQTVREQGMHRASSRHLQTPLEKERGSGSCLNNFNAAIWTSGQTNNNADPPTAGEEGEVWSCIPRGRVVCMSMKMFCKQLSLLLLVGTRAGGAYSLSFSMEMEWEAEEEHPMPWWQSFTPVHESDQK